MPHYRDQHRSSGARPVSLPVRHPEALPKSARARRSLMLIVLTLFLPGSTQLAAGNRDLGKLAFRTFLLVLVCAVISVGLYFLRPALIFGALTQTWPLLVILMGVFIAALGWAALFVDSWRLAVTGKPPIWAGGLASILCLACILATSGPLVYLGQLLSAHRTTVGKVFASGKAEKPIQGRYNILLIGGDAGAGRAGLRNDTMIVLSVDAETGRSVQIGIPRNLEGTRFNEDSPMASVFPHGFAYSKNDRMINAVYRYASEHPKLYAKQQVKDPGAAAVVDAASFITGLKIHYYILVDMAGFEAMIDALGGISIQVNKRVPKASTIDRSVNAWIEPGLHKMDGETALWFARSRRGTTDYERMARQRCVLDAAVKNLEPATVLRRYTEIARTAPDLVTTDIPQEQLASFGQMALGMRGKPIVQVAIQPPAINTGNPDFGKIKKMVADALGESNRQERDNITNASLAKDAAAKPAAEPQPEPAETKPAKKGKKGKSGAVPAEPAPGEPVCSAA